MPIEYVVLVQKKKHMAAVRFWTILSHFGGKTHGSSARVNQIIFGGKNLAAVVFLPRKSTKMLPSLKSLECEIFYSTCKCQISQRTRFSVSILSISANSSGVGPDWKANNQIKFCIQHGGNIIDSHGNASASTLFQVTWGRGEWGLEPAASSHEGVSGQ